MFEVIYFPRSGNTKRIAEAIAGELRIQARDVWGNISMFKLRHA